MPAPAAAASCVLPSISRLRNTLTCASVTVELLLAPSLVLAVRTATNRQIWLSDPADLIVADHHAPTWASGASAAPLRAHYRQRSRRSDISQFGSGRPSHGTS